MHLPVPEIQRILDTAITKYAWLLITDTVDAYSPRTNQDIEFGAVRPLDVTLPPFGLVPKEELVFEAEYERFKKTVLVPGRSRLPESTT
jgi:hypothetical protein